MTGMMVDNIYWSDETTGKEGAIPEKALVDILRVEANDDSFGWDYVFLLHEGVEHTLTSDDIIFL